MNSFFNLDGPFYKWGTEVADVMILSILWLLCSVPLVTLGASTTALFYVYGKKVRGEDPYIVKMFFKSFKENFKPATLLTFILGVLWFSSYLYYKMLISGAAPLWLKGVGMFFILQVTVLTLYAFPILSRFHMPVKNIIVSSFVFGNKHIFTTITCGALFGVSISILTTPTPFAIFSFGIYALLASFFFQKIFTKQIETMEKNNLKEITNEEELED